MPAPAGTESFEEFFRSEQAKLLRAYVVTGDRYLAEEAMQDAFAALWERWEQVPGLEYPSGYLYRTALNRVRRHHRCLTRFMAAVVRMAPREHRSGLGRQPEGQARSLSYGSSHHQAIR